MSDDEDGVQKHLQAPAVRRLWFEAIDRSNCRRGVYIKPHAHAGSRLPRKMPDTGSLLGNKSERTSDPSAEDTFANRPQVADA